MFRWVLLLSALLSFTAIRAEGSVLEHTARPPSSGVAHVGNGCQTQGLCAAIERLGLYSSLHLDTAATATEAGPEVALGGRLGIGLDLARHVAIEASFPTSVVYQGAAQTLLFAGPLQVGTRVVIGSASPTLFGERSQPRASVILGADAQLRLSQVEGDPRAAPVTQTGILQPLWRAAVELNWGPLQLTPEVAGLLDASAVKLQVAGRLSLRLSSVLWADLSARSQIPLYEKESSQACSSGTYLGIGVRGRWWLGMVDPVLDCNGWMLSDDTLLPLFKFGEPGGLGA